MKLDRDFAGFIKWTVAALALGVVLVVGLVALVDPYRLHRLLERDGFNLVKPRPQRYLSEIKLAGAMAARPPLLLMGNSRVDVGIDPDGAAIGGAAYTLAVPGTGVGTSRQQFTRLIESGARPASLLLGVEFFDFLLDPDGVEPADTPTPGRLARARWKVDTLFSVEALLDAARTLTIQHDPDAATMSARGFNPLADYLRPARRDGYHPFFQQRALESARKLVRAPRGVVLSRGDSSADWRELGRLLDQAARQGTDVKLVIYPYHAQLMAMLEASGLWPVFEQWKLRLLREIARVNLAYPQARIVLWDFSGYGAFQCEPIPAKGDLTATKWYWESGHFKAALGEMMLARLFGRDGAVPVADFGARLAPAGWQANRDRIARERRACEAAEPAMFREAAAMVAAVQPESRRAD